MPHSFPWNPRLSERLDVSRIVRTSRVMNPLYESTWPCSSYMRSGTRLAGHHVRYHKMERQWIRFPPKLGQRRSLIQTEIFLGHILICTHSNPNHVTNIFVVGTYLSKAAVAILCAGLGDELKHENLRTSRNRYLHSGHRAFAPMPRATLFEHLPLTQIFHMQEHGWPLSGETCVRIARVLLFQKTISSIEMSEIAVFLSWRMTPEAGTVLDERTQHGNFFLPCPSRFPACERGHRPPTLARQEESRKIVQVKSRATELLLSA